MNRKRRLNDTKVALLVEVPKLDFSDSHNLIISTLSVGHTDPCLVHVQMFTDDSHRLIEKQGGATVQAIEGVLRECGVVAHGQICQREPWIAGLQNPQIILTLLACKVESDAAAIDFSGVEFWVVVVDLQPEGPKS